MSDVKLIDEGSLVMFKLNTVEARNWVDENVEVPAWAWFMGAFAVEPRYAAELAVGMSDAGFDVEMP